jgi:predicted Zn-dependent protease
VPPLELLSLGEVVHRLDRVLETSPCDETELVWIEVVRSAASTRSHGDVPPHAEATVLVRVREAERIGVYQTLAGTVGELCNAVRQTLGQTRIEPPTSWRCPPAPSEQRLDPSEDLVDREIAGLEPDAARERLSHLAREGESAVLGWAVGRLVLANSRGLAQQAAATAASLEVRCPGSVGTGRAAAAARSLEALAMEDVFERARYRHAGPNPETEQAATGAEPDRVPVVLSPEAVISLLGLLNRHALSARSFHQDTSMLRGALGRQVFDPKLTLIDDGARSDEKATEAGSPCESPRGLGLPFPFDLFGYATRPVEMVRAGTFVTPAVDRELEASLDLPRTPHAVTEGDSRAGHLWMEAGDLEEEGLLSHGDGGVWIGWLERTECFDTPDGRFRTRARGVRRIDGGHLGPGLPDLVWEGKLGEILERFAGVGRERVCLSMEDGFRGGITAPAVVLPEARGLTFLHT